jgi:choline dehydrogenase-like flavoprotein
MVGWDSAPDRWPEGDGHSPMPGAFEGAVLFMANALGEVLPRPENGVEIDPHRQDADGIPIVRIHLDHGPNEARMREDALASLREMLGCVGGVPIGEHLLGPGSSIHEVGTARMGVDRRSSVVNPDNETWDVRNLFISDGACWPTSGWQNVTLTLIAITARCCDAIAGRLGSSSPR